MQQGNVLESMKSIRTYRKQKEQSPLVTTHSLFIVDKNLGSSIITQTAVTATEGGQQTTAHYTAKRTLGVAAQPLVSN